MGQIAVSQSSFFLLVILDKIRCISTYGTEKKRKIQPSIINVNDPVSFDNIQSDIGIFSLSIKLFLKLVFMYEFIVTISVKIKEEKIKDGEIEMIKMEDIVSCADSFFAISTVPTCSKSALSSRFQ